MEKKKAYLVGAAVGLGIGAAVRNYERRLFEGYWESGRVKIEHGNLIIDMEVLDDLVRTDRIKNFMRFCQCKKWG